MKNSLFVFLFLCTAPLFAYEVCLEGPEEICAVIQFEDLTFSKCEVGFYTEKTQDYNYNTEEWETIYHFNSAIFAYDQFGKNRVYIDKYSTQRHYPAPNLNTQDAKVYSHRLADRLLQKLRARGVCLD